MCEVRKPGGEQDRLLEALLVETVRSRQSDGQRTRLRELHILLDVAQPLALRLARRLEDEGTLVVNQDPLDALASTVTVRPPVANYLQRIASGKSARK